MKDIFVPILLIFVVLTALDFLRDWKLIDDCRTKGAFQTLQWKTSISCTVNVEK